MLLLAFQSFTPIVTLKCWDLSDRYLPVRTVALINFSGPSEVVCNVCGPFNHGI